MPSIRNSPGVQVVEAGNQTQHGGFAGAGRADDADKLALLDSEGYIRQHHRIVVITEGNVIECDRTADATEIDRVRALMNDVVGGKDLLDAFQRDRRLGNRAGHAREIFHWLEKLHEVSQVHGQRSRRHGPGHDQRCASPEHYGGAERNHDAYHWRQHGFY